MWEFLEFPRSWVELEAWRCEHGFGGYDIRHQLAWLEHSKLARSEEWDGVVVWLRTERGFDSL